MRRQRLCPVCWQKVTRTRKGNILGHFDSMRLNTCPGDVLPFSSTILRTAEFLAVAS